MSNPVGELRKKKDKSDVEQSFLDFVDDKNLYIEDTIYNLEFQTDCHAFDRARKVMTHQFTEDYYEKKLGDGGTGHIMARCRLIHDYLDHRKGKRKSQKHSPEWLRRNNG